MKKTAEEQFYSISQLAKLTGLDRATVVKRLEGVPHAEGAKGAKTYRLAAALPPLIKGQSSAYDEAELRKMEAEADLKEHKLAVEQQQYVPVKDVRDYATRLFQGIHRALAVQFPHEVAATLYKAESQAQIEEILKRELGRRFNGLRDNHKRFL